jgi:hypothetical protein
MIPGFADGGLAGPDSGTPAAVGQWANSEFGASNRMVIWDTEDAPIKAIYAALQQAADAAGAGGHQSANLSQIENWWTGAGGPGGNIAHIAAAITGAESGFNVRAVQHGQPYATTG